MTYFCFIESDSTSVPHMEPLTADTLDAARDEARRLLATHVSGVAAHVFEDDRKILSLRAEPRGA